MRGLRGLLPVAFMWACLAAAQTFDLHVFLHARSVEDMATRKSHILLLPLPPQLLLANAAKLSVILSRGGSVSSLKCGLQLWLRGRCLLGLPMPCCGHSCFSPSGQRLRGHALRGHCLRSLHSRAPSLSGQRLRGRCLCGLHSTCMRRVHNCGLLPSPPRKLGLQLMVLLVFPYGMQLRLLLLQLWLLLLWLLQLLLQLILLQLILL